MTRNTGDPTDTSIKLRPLEPASGQALARDLVLKTRRRKGLGDQIAVSKYLDDEFIVRVTLSCIPGRPRALTGLVAARTVCVGACRPPGVVVYGLLCCNVCSVLWNCFPTCLLLCVCTGRMAGCWCERGVGGWNALELGRRARCGMGYVAVAGGN